MVLSNTQKGILTIIGGTVIHLSTGTIHSFGFLNPFFISYLHIFDKSLTLDDGFFLYPLGVLFMRLFIVAANALEKQNGPRM